MEKNLGTKLMFLGKGSIFEALTKLCLHTLTGTWAPGCDWVHETHAGNQQIDSGNLVIQLLG